MLTHDMEPITDIIKNVKRLFQDPKSCTSFLLCKSGGVSEVQIGAKGIKTFAQICKENIDSINDEVIGCVYLRRNFEIINEKGLEYNLLSSLLHGREKPTKKENNAFIERSKECSKSNSCSSNVQLTWWISNDTHTILHQLMPKFHPYSV